MTDKKSKKICSKKFKKLQKWYFEQDGKNKLIEFWNKHNPEPHLQYKGV